MQPLRRSQSGSGQTLRRSFLRLAVFLVAAGLAMANAPPGFAQNASPVQRADLSLSLSPDQALEMARRALDLGRPDLAADIATQILTQRPTHAAASLMLAAAQSRMGKAVETEAAARKAFRLTQSSEVRFEAAFLTASALAAQGRPQQAKYWLRRADTHAQTPEDSRLLRGAFAAVDRRTPYRLSFQINGGPSDNVNGGSLHDTFWLDGTFPIAIAQALPGVAWQGQARLTYRVIERADRALSLFGSLSGRKVWLSAEAKALDTTARGADFGSVGLDLGVIYRQRLSQTLGFAVEAQIGHRSYGSGTTRNSQRLRFTMDRALTQDRVLSLNLTGTAMQAPDGSARNSAALAAEAGLSLPVGKGTVTARLGYDAVLSPSAGVAWRGAVLGLDVQLPPVAESIDLTVFGTVQMKDYWKHGAAPDLSMELGATARFHGLSVMGFAPTLSLSAARNRSDIVVRDSASTSMSLGLSSTF